LIRKKPSNDVDIALVEKNNFSYDANTRKFTDKFYLNLCQIFAEYGLLLTINENSGGVKIDNVYGDKLESDDEKVKENDEDINFDLDQIDFKVDHIKYNFRVQCDDQQYNFILDASFLNSFDELHAFKPSCYQDSLYVNEKFALRDLINAKKSPVYTIITIEEFLSKNIKSYLEKSPHIIMSDIINGVIEIYNIDGKKLVLKLARFLLDENFNVKKTAELPNHIVELERYKITHRMEYVKMSKEEQKKYTDLVVFLKKENDKKTSNVTHYNPQNFVKYQSAVYTNSTSKVDGNVSFLEMLKKKKSQE
jgi:hypothetical protein